MSEKLRHEELPEEKVSEKNERMAKGNISEEEIQKYLENPFGILFTHNLVDKKTGQETPINVKYLTREFLQSTLENVQNSWDAPTFENLKSTLEKHFEQKESGIPGLINAEYYIATDAENNPMGMTGIYSVDIQGGAGFATRNLLDKEKHCTNLAMGWYCVDKKSQGIGLGKYLAGWTEEMARTRGADHFEIETDDFTETKRAVELYKKAGYTEGLPIKDFFGPGRDLNIYYANISEEKEIKPEQATTEITDDNKNDILKIAQNNYSPERFEEFKVCLNLILSQNPNANVIRKGHTLVINDKNGKPESFAIYADGIYNNELPVYWIGADVKERESKANLLEAIKNVARKNNRDVVVINTENEDKELSGNGFFKAKHGIPGVFGKGDDTKLLLFSKSFKK